MDKKQAINIVRATFESSFDKGRFTNFIKNLLNEPDLSNAFGPRSGNYIPDAFKGYVEKYERLGKYEDSEEKRVDLLIVHLKRETSIERARSMQRNFVAGYLQGKFGSDTQKDAALVAFVAPDGEDWRFSLVRLEVRLDASVEGKIKVIDEFTPAKRWSFLVGSHEKSHTAQTQFVPIMEDTEENPTLAELEEAFNIEKVTNEFFKEYRRLFIWTKKELDKAVKKNAKTEADFESKGIDTVNLAKKLLGQIIFLYYLQKKGWFGVPADAAWGEGSRDFLRELFEKCAQEKKNFFNDYLEPLFYEALRLDRSHDDHYYSRFDCKIPFLNGGLFDPMNNYDWVKTEILLSNDLFSNKHKTDEGDTGDGILDIFDRYNFTVKEDEPFEKEVAIDPELLGKAYEKFNAIRPDNYKEFLEALKSGKKGDESKFNKQYGVYYTPREIVHYMCQQSLINYLYSELNPNVTYQSLGDDQLDMFGNAAKSGQMGMTVEHRPMAEVPKEDIAFLIQHGEEIFENDQMVLEKEKLIEAGQQKTTTSKLLVTETIRTYALLIDEKLASIKVCDPAVGSGAFPVGMMSEIVKARQVLGIYTKTKKTLYDFKRQCIENSLYGVDIDSGAVEIAKLRLWLSLVVDEDDPQNIKPLPNLDYKIVCGNSLLGFPDKWGSPIEKEIEGLIHQHFSETNPTRKEQLKTQIDEKIQSRYKNSLRAFGYQVNFDFRTVFSEVFQLKGGFDVIIANPPYVTIGGKEDAYTSKSLKDAYTTQFSSYEYKTNLFVLFVERALNLVTEKGIVVFILPRTLLDNYHMLKIRQAILKKTRIISLLELRGNVFEDAVIGGNLVLVLEKCEHQRLRDNNFANVASLETLDLETVVFNQTLQADYLTSFQNRFFVGTNAAQNLFSKIAENKSLLSNVCDIRNGANTGNSAKILLSDFQKTNKHRPILEGKDVNRYAIEWGGLWINYDPKLKEKIDVSKLDTRQAKIDFALREEGIFNSEKIVIRQTADKLIAAIDVNKYITRHSTHLILSKDQSIGLRYILALLNSKLLNYYYSLLVPEKGKVFAEVKIVNLEKLPIVAVDNTKQQNIVKLVERILVAKRANPRADTSKWEAEIDQLVYQLYGLTQEEQDIVDGKA